MTSSTFRHEAMATFFEVTIDARPEAYARQAAAAAFRELDRLESELSRFVESSDIARANRLACGESMRIGDDALQCLLVAADVSLATGGAFDPAYASTQTNGARPGAPPFTLDVEAHALTSHVARLHLDLGAVGKGYALDVMAGVLREWDIEAACLNSGGSTVLVLGASMGEAGWTVGLGEGRAYRTLVLRDAALSGSGTAVKGAHLIDPRSRAPAVRSSRVWSLASTAAQADALSTAFFVMTDAEMASFCATHPHIGGAGMDPAGELAVHGMLRESLGAPS